jgi:hypothetical protein
MSEQRAAGEAGDAAPIAWRSIVYGTPVCAADGTRVGVVREVLGSDVEDIFHGLRIELDGQKRDVIVLANDVTLITAGRLETDLDGSAIEGLPPYTETDTYHLASVGWLRRHLGWKRDSGSDEEPG